MKRLRRVILLLVVVALLVWWLLPAGGPHVQPGSVLAIQLSGAYVESSAPSFVARALGEARQPFISILGEFAKAERDSRIRAVALRVRRLEIGWAMAQELRGARGIGAQAHQRQGAGRAGRRHQAAKGVAGVDA